MAITTIEGNTALLEKHHGLSRQQLAVLTDFGSDGEASVDIRDVITLLPKEELEELIADVTTWLAHNRASRVAGKVGTAKMHLRFEHERRVAF